MADFATVMLVCGDLSRSRAFYRDVLQLNSRAENLPEWVDFDLDGGATLRLHPKSELLTVRPGSIQLGFSVHDVDAFVGACAESGVPIFQDPYDEPFGRLAVISDPDGYPIQIVSTQ